MNFEELEKNLGFKFRRPNLLKEALTHRSYLNEFRKQKIQSNERLEFLGDAVLSLVVSNWLFKKFPHFPEGKLTNLRSNLVKTGSLAQIAQKLKIGEHLLLSKGEKESQGQKNPTLLANTLEAIIGALFLDQGSKTVEIFIRENFEFLLKGILRSGRLKDYKSLLQEKTQAQMGQSPIYKTAKEKGPEHNKIFTVNVLVKNVILATGIGKSKQKAQEEAAKKALENLALKK
jgi:ribonuclease III